MNTPEGRIKGVQTMREKHGTDIYAKIGARGGKNSPNRPMRDPVYASRAAKIRWVKYRYEKGLIDKAEYDKQMMELTSVSPVSL